MAKHRKRKRKPLTVKKQVRRISNPDLTVDQIAKALGVTENEVRQSLKELNSVELTQVKVLPNGRVIGDLFHYDIAGDA